MDKTALDNSNIIETNNDACRCKLYAVERGYWTDPYLKILAGSGHNERRTPEISLGYYVRVHGIRSLIEKFIKLSNNECQIINLGCGFDTTIFYLLDKENLHFKHFIDIDFDEITEIKSNKIRRLSILQNKLPTENKSFKIPCGFHSSLYTILPADLRDTTQLDNQLKLLSNNNIIDYTKPTLFLSECVLIYMSNEHSLNFEQINMNDRFGEIMFDNLKHRSCHLIGLDSCQSLNSQYDRYLNANFTSAYCITLNDYYKKYLNLNEKQRIEMIDGGLDEKELLEQLFEHYCFSWAYRDEKNLGLDKITFEDI
jgi:[phosphatase 2A protein]-leucine-carboxy methyltransferase